MKREDTLANRANAKSLGADCVHCPGNISDACVGPDSVADPKLIVVGEGPGYHETVEGRPFVGPSGNLLNRTLSVGGHVRSNTHITNAVLCDVPKSELSAARKCCMPRLQAELNALPPVPIVALGAHALASVQNERKERSILEWRGTIISRNEVVGVDSPQPPGAPPTTSLLLPMVHPAFVLRSPQWEGIFRHDFERLRRLENWKPPEAKPDIETYFIGEDESIEPLLALGPEVSIDVETSKDPPTVATLLCIGLSDGKRSIVLKWKDVSSDRKGYFQGALNRCLHTRVAVTHNGPAFDWVVLRRHGIYVQQWEDTLLMTHAVASHLPKDLGHVATLYLDVGPWKRFQHDTDQELYTYNSRDVLYTAQIAAPLRQTVREMGYSEAVYQHDRVVSQLCHKMQLNGMGFDSARAPLFSKLLSEREEEYKRDASLLVGHEFNLASTKQLGAVMFGELGAPVYFKKNDKPVLNKNALLGYAAHPNETISKLAVTTLNYRKVSKCRSTYVDGIKPLDGRVHPSWGLGPVTGRWRCGDPNMATLPKPQNDASLELGGIRSLYIAGPGRCIVGFDAAQLEFRVAAYLSGDPVMIKACEGGDVHSANAALLFGKAFTEAPGSKQEGPKKKLRDMTKNAGFALCYGASAITIHTRVIVDGGESTLQQCEFMLRQLHKEFGTYYAFQAEELLKIQRRGWAESPLLKRRRWFGHTPKPTEAMNFPIQSGAADLFNARLPILDSRIANIPGALMISHVYDSGYIECNQGDAEHVSEMIKTIFETPVVLGGRNVIFPMDVHVGRTWAEAT